MWETTKQIWIWIKDNAEKLLISLGILASIALAAPLMIDEPKLDLLIHTSDTIMHSQDVVWTKEMEDTDRASNMKQGYIQRVEAEGYQWGRLENDPKRFIHIIIPAKDFNPAWLDKEVDINGETIQDRKFKFDIKQILTEREYSDLESIPYNEPTIRPAIVKNISSPVVEQVDWNKEKLRTPLKLHGSAGNFTIRPTGSSPAGDYTSLQTAIETEAANISGGSTDANFYIQHNGTNWGADAGDWDVDGWTMGTNNMLIQTQGDARHSGTYSTTAHRIENATEFFDIEIPNVTVDGIQGKMSGTGTGTTGLETSLSADAITIEDCLILLTDSTSGGSGIANFNAGTLIIENCSIHKPKGSETDSEGIFVQSGGDTTKIYNTTVSGFDDGIEFDGGTGHEIKNSAVFNNADDIDDATSATIDYCATDDGDGTNAVDISPGGTEADDWNSAVTDYVNADHSVKDTSSVLYNAGTDLSGSGITDDIIGTARPQSTNYDIGAFEFIVGGEPPASGGEADQHIIWFY